MSLPATPLGRPSTLRFSTAMLVFGALSSLACEQASLPVARDGVLDLRRWNFQTQGVVPLAGEWTVWWQQLAPPGQLDPGSLVGVSVPGGWPQTGDPLTHATYRLEVLLPPAPQTLALTTGTVFNAHRTLWNQQVVHQVGSPGTTLGTTTPRLEFSVRVLPPTSDRAVLTMEVANFRNNRHGIFRPPVLGHPDSLMKKTGKSASYEMALIAALLILALYNIVLFAFRPIFLAPLLMGLISACFALFFSTLGSVPLYHLAPDLCWEVLARLTFLGWAATSPLGVLLLEALFPRHLSRRLFGALLLINAINCAIGLFLPHILLRQVYPVLQMVAAGTIVFLFVVRFRTLSLRSPQAGPYALLILVVLGLGFNDLLNNRNILQNGFLLPYNILLLNFALSVIVSRRITRDQDEALETSRAAREAEHAALELQERLTLDLQQEVDKQTLALRDALDELTSTQNQMMQQARMATMGNLASGMAHEIGNPLNLTVGGAEALESIIEEISKRAPEGLGEALSAADECVRLILRGSDRIEGILRQLNQLVVTSDDTTKARCNVLEVLDTTGELLSHKLRASEVELIKEVDPSVVAEVASGELGQVFLNLLLNAVQAINGRGRITVRGEVHGDQVQIDLKDDGPGVPASISTQIFDPFFTTRPPGEGTGIGLSLSYQMVSDWGGTLTLEPSSEGAHFKILVPL